MSSKLDYLQKYLGKGDALPGVEGDKAKKKKKKKKGRNDFQEKFRSRIIDADDAFGHEEETEIKVKKKKKSVEDEEEEEDHFETNEDKPQIAGFVDDRPEIEIMKERFTTSSFQPVIKIEDDEDDNSPIANAQSSLEGVKVKEEPPDTYENQSESNRQRHDSSSGSETQSRNPRRRHDSLDSDNSPPRRRARHDSDDDQSPKRSEDVSPLRRRRQRHDSSGEDQSPPRRRAQSDSPSPPRRRVKEEPVSDKDMSPPRRRRPQTGEDEEDLSPPRRPVQIKDEPNVDEDLSPPRRRAIKAERRDSDGDLSPPRKMSKTLDGKKAGLQDAKSLKSELDNLKKREKEMFSTLSSDVSGRGAETKVRGRLKAKEEEERRKKEKNEINEEVKEKYAKWSKGIKQAEEIQKRIAEDLHEMDKPLARTVDDVDREDFLKNRERAEDPMLQYIKKKKEKKHVGPKMPTYKGTYAPNRFGIPPGYRWDGVDRSNGFEKKLAKKQNDRKAIKDDSYKWSTEDM